MKTMEIVIPEGYINCKVENDKYFICNDNCINNQSVFIVPLPKGKWSILKQAWVGVDHRYGKVITLWHRTLLDRLTFNWMIKKHIIKAKI